MSQPRDDLGRFVQAQLEGRSRTAVLAGILKRQAWLGRVDPQEQAAEEAARRQEEQDERVRAATLEHQRLVDDAQPGQWWR